MIGAAFFLCGAVPIYICNCNPLRGSYVSDRSRSNAALILIHLIKSKDMGIECID